MSEHKSKKITHLQALAVSLPAAGIVAVGASVAGNLSIARAYATGDEFLYGYSQAPQSQLCTRVL